jgi:hypothetical protein
MIGLVRGIINRRKNILERRAARDRLQNVGHSNPLSPNTGPPTAFTRLDRNPPQPFWTHILTARSLPTTPYRLLLLKSPDTPHVLE